MAQQEGAGRPTSPGGGDRDYSFPHFPRADIAGPPSIISSRMTDIASEDGGESEGQKGSGSQRRSGLYSDSRPGTARTGVSSRTPWSGGAALRLGPSNKRGSVAGSVTSASASVRPASSTSRSHVPSLTSHAFFRPMSSQKLQAQRGIARPTTMNRQFTASPDAQTDGNEEQGRQSALSSPIARVGGQVIHDSEMRPPP